MLEVHILKARQDNYVYVLRDEARDFVGVVDPSEAEPVEKFLAEKNWKLNLILITHHHHDHVGGNLALAKRYQPTVVCSAHDFMRVPAATRGVKDGEFIDAGSTSFQVLEIPGHTLGAVAFYCAEENLVFTGDTLFTLGCGRLFEGSPEQMWHSLKALAALPDDTQVYCGHEYGVQNALFTLSVNPNSKMVERVLSSFLEGSAQGKGTVPTSIGFEKALNPFVKAQDAADFARLRRLKDEFRLEEDPSLG